MADKRYMDVLSRFRKERAEYKSMDPNDRVLLVDGMNLFIRTFCAVPILNDEGYHIGGLVGFLRSLATVARELNPTRIVIVFDGKGGSSRRRKLFSGYKEGRAMKSKVNRVVGFENTEDQQQSMYWQLGRLIEYLNAMPVTVVVQDHVEADDVIAHLATSYFKNEVVIMSNDRDFMQLADDRISCWLPFEKKLYHPEDVKEKFGVSAKNHIIYKSIMGDSSDGIPKIKGVGTAFIEKRLPLLKEDRYVDIDELLQYAKEQNDLKSYAGYEALLENRETLEMNFRLMQLKDPDISMQIKARVNSVMSAAPNKYDRATVRKMIDEDKMHDALRGFNSWIAAFDNVSKMNEKRF